jgi:hypothetical protein
MLGQPEEPEHKGLIPRSLEQIFKSSQTLECQGWKFKMQVKRIQSLSSRTLFLFDLGLYLRNVPVLMASIGMIIGFHA